MKTYQAFIFRQQKRFSTLLIVLEVLLHLFHLIFKELLIQFPGRLY